MNIKLALVGLAACSLVATSAAALNFKWVFTPDLRIEGPGTPIDGVILGLKEGANSGKGLRISVNHPDFRPGRLDFYQFDSTRGGGSAFVVTNSQITFANAKFVGDGFDSWLNVYFGGYGGYDTGVDITFKRDGTYGYYDHASVGPDSYSPLGVSETGSEGLLGLGFCMFGAYRSRIISAAAAYRRSKSYLPV